MCKRKLITVRESSHIDVDTFLPFIADLFRSDSPLGLESSAEAVSIDTGTTGKLTLGSQSTEHISGSVITASCPELRLSDLCRFKNASNPLTESCSCPEMNENSYVHVHTRVQPSIRSRISKMLSRCLRIRKRKKVQNTSSRDQA